MTGDVVTLEESRVACRELTRATAKNFGITFRVLPRDQARDMQTLYAFMRRTDDLSDCDEPVEQRRADLNRWRESFHAAAANEITKADWQHDDLLPAVGDLIQRRRLDTEHFDAVIAGCLQDTYPVSIQTADELEAYCYRVAGAVGLCCIGIWGYRGQSLAGSEDDKRKAEAFAVRTGFAFQLTNILRDVAEDASNGRCYLPESDLRRFDVEFDALEAAASNRKITEPIRRLVIHEVGIARAAYDESAPLAEFLSHPGRRILTAMRLVYGRLLDEIEHLDGDVFSSRVRVSRLRKLVAILRGYATR